MQSNSLFVINQLPNAGVSLTQLHFAELSFAKFLAKFQLASRKLRRSFVVFIKQVAEHLCTNANALIKFKQKNIKLSAQLRKHRP